MEISKIIQYYEDSKSPSFQQNITLGDTATVGNIAKYENASVKTTHLLAQDPPMLPSTIVGSTNAVTEATRLQTLFGSQRYTYRVQAFVAPLQIKVGSIVTLNDDRFGLSSGTKAVVTGIVEYLLDNKLELELWA